MKNGVENELLSERCFVLLETNFNKFSLTQLRSYQPVENKLCVRGTSSTTKCVEKTFYFNHCAFYVILRLLMTVYLLFDLVLFLSLYSSPPTSKHVLSHVGIAR